MPAAKGSARTPLGPKKHCFKPYLALPQLFDAFITKNILLNILKFVEILQKLIDC
jgi:hypothetical protein